MSKLTSDPLSNESLGKLLDDLADSAELVFYAASEHIDDLRSIAEHFYSDRKQRAKCKSLRELIANLKSHGAFMTAATNHIKHHQSRFRCYAVRFTESDLHGLLVGYFIEGVDRGVVGPNPVLHGKSSNLFALPSLVWATIFFLLQCSRSLFEFLQDRPQRIEGPAFASAPHFVECAIAATRLPLYLFDEEHPFDKTKLIVEWDVPNRIAARSEIVGSFGRPWAHYKNMVLCGDLGGTVGDGVTKQFRITRATTVRFCHWL